jgi:hypothetical protein
VRRKVVIYASHFLGVPAVIAATRRPFVVHDAELFRRGQRE